MCRYLEKACRALGGYDINIRPKGPNTPNVHLENLKIAIPNLPCQFHSPRIAQCASILLGQKMSHLHRPSCSHSKIIQTQRNQALGCQK